MQKKIMMLSIHGDPAATIGSEEQGGQPIYINDISKLLSENYEIDIFTRKKNKVEEEIIKIFPNVNVIRIQAGPVEFISKEKIYLYLNEFFMNMIRWIKKNKRDYLLIHSHYWDSASIALKSKDYFEIPVVHNCHSLGRVKYEVIGKTKTPFADMRLLEEKLILKYSNAITASTPQEIENILNLYNVMGENIKLICAGINENLFRPIEKKIAAKKVDFNSKNTILFVGRINKEKGLRILIQALGQVKKKFNQEIKLLIIGGDISEAKHSEIENKEKKHLKELIEQLKLSNNVHFLGSIARQWLPYYYSIADICVVPSMYESFGLVAVEAMACATPVIASKVGGLAHTVKNEFSGLHFEKENFKDLAEKIIELITDPEKINKMGINARTRVSENFGLNKTVEQIKELYKSLIES